MRMLITAAIALATTVSVLAFLSYLIQSTGASLTEMMRIFASEESQQQAHHELAEELERTASVRERVREYVLHGDADTVRFLSEVDELAVDVGVTLETDELAVQPGSDSFKELAITLTIEGTEGAVVRMLSLLETLPYHSYIQRVDFSRDAERTGYARSIVELAVTFVEV